MFKVNPYRPGAGLMPVYLAGRDEDIKNIENLFDGLMLNIPTQSVIFSGLRGENCSDQQATDHCGRKRDFLQTYRGRRAE